MARISQARVTDFLRLADGEPIAHHRGRHFEDLTAYVFSKIPGVRLQSRNQLNAAQSEEIDLAFWNERRPAFTDFLPNIVMIEVKNWTAPVGVQEITVFDQKIKRRGLEFGILVAAIGITGNPSLQSAGFDILRAALIERRSIVVITRDDLTRVSSSDALIELIQAKLCDLVVAGTFN